MALTPPAAPAPAAPAAPKMPLRAETLSSLLKRPEILGKFNDVLKNRSAGFVSSILSLQNMNVQLKSCDPMSIVSSAMIAATLDLPINPNLGFAYIIPYGNQAQFQMGYKGFVQLGIRSGEYETMNCSELYEDELEDWDPVRGVLKLTPKEKWQQRDAGQIEKLIGYTSFFKLLRGFNKYEFWSKPKVMAHAKKYSKAFVRGSGPWRDDFDAMGKKTVLKTLLNHWGILSIEMQDAVTLDQAVVHGLDKEDRKVEYPDAIETQPLTPDEDAPKEMQNDAQEPAPKEKAPEPPANPNAPVFGKTENKK
jgi:recombination protein RecT